MIWRKRLSISLKMCVNILRRAAQRENQQQQLNRFEKRYVCNINGRKCEKSAIGKICNLYIRVSKYKASRNTETGGNARIYVEAIINYQ